MPLIDSHEFYLSPLHFLDSVLQSLEGQSQLYLAAGLTQIERDLLKGDPDFLLVKIIQPKCIY